MSTRSCFTFLQLCSLSVLSLPGCSWSAAYL
uniref:Uncharacterized protein n=1 Tax=Anguilla anguilla TaxID=7936 RepID=A0A0E9TBI9_ANGAN